MFYLLKHSLYLRTKLRLCPIYRVFTHSSAYSLIRQKGNERYPQQARLERPGGIGEEPLCERRPIDLTISLHVALNSIIHPGTSPVDVDRQRQLKPHHNVSDRGREMS